MTKLKHEIVENEETRQLLRDIFELGPQNMKGMTYQFKIKTSEESAEETGDSNGNAT